jgi:dihydrofolate reductase
MKPEKTTSIIAIAAISIDGKIAQHKNQQTDWTSREDKIALRKLLDETDVIGIGHTTYRIHEERLAARRCIIFTREVVGFEQKSENLFLCNLDNVSLREVLAPYHSVALLGGAQIYTYFLERDLIDELHLTIEPVAFGNGLNLFERKNSLITNFKLVSVQQLNAGGTMLLRYRRPSYI